VAGWIADESNLDIDDWDLFGICCLKFEVWNFNKNGA
jgi:hypothetical protein